jgi:NifU-like protein involved in Fe-S cluster formation
VYSEIVTDHFFHPRNAYRMEKPDVIGKAGEPGHGPFMLLYLKVEGERIAEASYQTYGCGPAIAAGSLLTEKLKGVSREAARALDEGAINEALGGLPGNKRHCSRLAATVLKNALEQWRGDARHGKAESPSS